MKSASQDKAWKVLPRRSGSFTHLPDLAYHLPRVALDETNVLYSSIQHFEQIFK